MNGLTETRGKSSVFAGEIVYVSEDNPSFFLLKEVRQNCEEIESTEGIWLRSSPLSRKHSLNGANLSVGDHITFKGLVALGQSQNETLEHMIIMSSDLQIVDSKRRGLDYWHDGERIRPKLRVTPHERVLTSIYDDPIPQIPFGDHKRPFDEKPRIMFSGRIKGMSRTKADDAATNLGCIVCDDFYDEDYYLIVGEEGDPRWKFGKYGRKIESALDSKEDGKDIKIIAGQEFLKQLRCLSE